MSEVVSNTTNITEKIVIKEGVMGEHGLSSYQVWLAQGNVGTEKNYLDSLAQPALDVANLKAAELNTLEQSILSQELARKSAEDARVLDETIRTSNESLRELSENTRVSNESTRESDEAIRSDNESTRESDEAIRSDNESTRESDEAIRSDNESTRSTNESKRVVEENKRALSEFSRVTEEGKRVNAETVRASAEDLRATAEKERQTQFNDAQIDRTNQFNIVKSNFESVVSTAESQVQTNILETAVEEKFNNLEQEYAEDLTLTKTQLAEITTQINYNPMKEELNLELVRTGAKPFDDINYIQFTGDSPLTVELDITSSPNFKLLSGFGAVAGIDPEGYAVNQAGTKRTCDGGKTFETITSGGMVTPFIWFDAQGNAYRASGKIIYRSDASNGYKNYNFVQKAMVDNGQIVGFSFCEDGLGGVYFAEYGFGMTHTNFLYSHDWGATFTKKIINYGQLHFHTVHFHKPSGNLYLVVGEGGSWKGLLKSTDRGVNFTQITALANVIQPISATTKGKYIVWGKDSAPSGFLLHNTEDDTIKELRTDNTISEIGGSPNYVGFYYSKINVNSLTVSPGGLEAGNLTSIYPLVYLDGINKRGALINPINPNNPLGKWIYGMDKNGYSYILDRAETQTYAFEKITKTRQKFYVTNKAEVVKALEMTKENSGDFNGMGYKKITNGNTSVGNMDVTAGDMYTFATFLRRGTLEATSKIRFAVLQESTTGGYTSKYYEVNTPNLPFDDKFHKLTFMYKVPTNISCVYLSWESYDSVESETNYHYVTAVSVQKDMDSSIRFALESTNDTYRIESGVNDEFMFKDIILNDGYSENLKVGLEIPLIKVNNIEIGLVKKTSVFGETHLYVKQKGVITNEIYCGQIVGTINGESKYHYSHNNFFKSNLRPAPIRLGVTGSKIAIFNPENGTVYGFGLDTRILGFVEIELLGSCYHSPHIYQNVVGNEAIKHHLLND